MITYDDLVAIGDDENRRIKFIRSVISQHKASEQYAEAETAEEYLRHRNPTITRFIKMLFTMTGAKVQDTYSTNFKMASNYFARFMVQINLFLLGNGITWEKEDTKEKLGTEFEDAVQKAGLYALTHGVSFGFWNYDHLDVFSLLEFAPLYDETTGALMAGVRFWQIDSAKPLRATLYEPDGYTEVIWRAGKKPEILQPKRAYMITVRTSEADGTEIVDGENYPTFPIVPLFGNPYKQSELVGLREQIDCYDLIKSGFANDMNDAAQIYWTVTNAGGMDDVDLAQFVERMHTIKAASVGDDTSAHAEAHTMEVPYASREALLNRIERDLYRDAMALDTYNIASGAVTATQIMAAYEPLNNKVDLYEYQVIRFVMGILQLAGIDDKPTFTRSKMINGQEEITSLIQAAQYLSEDYVTRKALSIFGDADQTEDVLDNMTRDESSRFGVYDQQEEQTEEEQPTEE